MNKPGITKNTPRLKFDRERAMVYKESLKLTLGDLSEIMQLRASNYFGTRGTMKAITVERAEILAERFGCNVEDFTDGEYLDRRQRNEWQRERVKRMNKESRERMKEAKKNIEVKERIRVEGNHIYITPPFMDTWVSAPKPQDEPNCIYMREHGVKRKIIEKQPKCTVMYLDEWKPIEDIRQAFRELRELL